MERITYSQLPDGNRTINNKKQLPITAVDKLADELVKEYGNPTYKKWYCGVIYDFGVQKVDEWRGRAKEGKEPAKLFSKYVSDYREFNNGNVGETNES